MIRTAGIIAEYNPFHRGHQHQLELLRAQGISLIVVAMSGCFVQRGAPAWADKYLRTHLALTQGVDLVFELPTLYALSSAEGFASGGVSLLTALKLDAFCFGCETDAPRHFRSASALLAEEPEDYRSALQHALRTGLSYPAARSHALRQCIPELPEELLSLPNNILALEYLKAIQRQQSPLRPLPVLRTDAGYHSSILSAKHPSSAAAIRAQYAKTASLASCRNAVPAPVYALLQEHSNRLGVTAADYSECIYYALRRAAHDGTLTQYGGIGEDLAHRIEHLLPHYTSLESFLLHLKRKNLTYTHLSRCLFRLLLGIPSSLLEETKRPVPYLRLLGMRRESSPWLRKITETPIITKYADASKRISGAVQPHARACLDIDLLAADLYRQMLHAKTGELLPDEYHAGVILL